MEQKRLRNTALTLALVLERPSGLNQFLRLCLQNATKKTIFILFSGSKQEAKNKLHPSQGRGGW